MSAVDVTSKVRYKGYDKGSKIYCLILTEGNVNAGEILPSILKQWSVAPEEENTLDISIELNQTFVWFISESITQNPGSTILSN